MFNELEEWNKEASEREKRLIEKVELVKKQKASHVEGLRILSSFSSFKSPNPRSTAIASNLKQHLIENQNAGSTARFANLEQQTKKRIADAAAEFDVVKRNLATKWGSELGKVQIEKNLITADKESLEQKVERLKEEKGVVEESLESVVEELKNIKGELKMMKGELKSKSEEARRERQEMQKEVDEMRKEVNEKQKEVDAKEKVLDEIIP